MTNGFYSFSSDFKSKKDKEKAEEWWNNSARQQRDPAGYERHKSAVDDYNRKKKKGKGGLKIKEVVEVPYVPEDATKRSMEELLSYSPKTGVDDDFNFDKGLADIKANAAELGKRLADRDPSRMRGFHPTESSEDSARYKMYKIHGESGKYDKGGRYLGGSDFQAGPNKQYVDMAGKLQVGVQNERQLFKEAMGSISSRSAKETTKLGRSLGVKPKKMKKALGIKKK